MKEPLSIRLEPEFKMMIIKWAKLHGMDVSTFIRKCIQEKIDAERQASLPEIVTEQVGFLRQMVFTCYDWSRDEDLIKQEVEHLWIMTQVNQDMPS